ncbi:toxin-antitoxin system HicB family antitoxin [Candidatus Halobeggiatoa sp. HSG11]|nr:toxin-antitoxin system HicB family antitoxin [Candidatus Halobeggiatoa sp. HSG11]
MTLKAGRPSERKDDKTPKELAIEAVQETDKPKLKRFNINIPADLHKQVKLKAMQEGLTLNDLGLKLLNEYLDE